MKFAIVSGSHRPLSESGRVGDFLAERLRVLFPESETYHLHLGKQPFPLWDEEVWTQGDKWTKLWSPVSQELKSSDAIIVVSPEWSGMVPAGLKNFFLLCGNQELAHKPGLIVAVSSGRSGGYPVVELRTSSYKNTRLCYIPDHVIVRDVGTVLKDDTLNTNPEDKILRQRIDYSLQVLKEYSAAFKQIRASGVVDTQTFPFGM